MKADRYLGMRPGDLDGKPYARYWNPDMGPLQDPVRRALEHGVEAAELGFPVAEANQLLEPGYLPLENGFTRLANGQVFVAVLTKMPRVTSEMIDWWFGWHYMESQRYKLWHPRAHVLNRAERMIGDDPGALGPREVSPQSQLRHGVRGRGPARHHDHVRGCLRVPRRLPLRSRRGRHRPLRRGRLPERAPRPSEDLIHLIRETRDGCEMRSRFWLGRIELRDVPAAGLLSKLAGSRFVAKRAVPIALGRDMVVHCAVEMNHLASFLPDLYADYHPRP